MFRHQEELNLKKQERRKYFEELYFNRDEREIEETQEKESEAETQEKAEKESPGRGTGRGSHAENGNEKRED